MERENFTIPTVSRVSMNKPPVGHIIHAPASATEVMISLSM
jgi:hypothetical protein